MKNGTVVTTAENRTADRSFVLGLGGLGFPLIAVALEWDSARGWNGQGLFWPVLYASPLDPALWIQIALTIVVNNVLAICVVAPLLLLEAARRRLWFTLGVGQLVVLLLTALLTWSS